MSARLRIVKVGGSLLELSDLAERLRRWLSEQPPATNVLLAGGGTLAEEVRRWDERFQLGQETSHWLCVDLLDVTAQLLKALLPNAHLCWNYTTLCDAIRAGDRTTIVFVPAGFLRAVEAQLAGLPLPQSWDVTSDSIAARLAEITGAGELVLLKSSLPKSFSQRAELGGEYVDRYFAHATQGLSKVRLVNLRDAAFAEVAY
jgi:5-(aminomethyl)-3-furanmethanol phosphate kinase